MSKMSVHWKVQTEQTKPEQVGRLPGNKDRADIYIYKNNEAKVVFKEMAGLPEGRPSVFKNNIKPIYN